MPLSATDLQRTFAQFMRDSPGGFPGLSKVELKATIDAIEAWVEANQASFNSALPQPARGVLSTQQKALGLCYVVRRRSGTLRTEED